MSPLSLDFVRIPAGEFAIGSNSKIYRQAGGDEIPQHSLGISDFYIMRYPVTNAQYLLFVQATNHRVPLYWKNGTFIPAQPEMPVVGVSFADALDFCRWAGEQTNLPIRLPTESEWEKAARGTDGRLYPWGNQWEASRCNSSESKIGAPSPIGKFSPQGDSPYGIADMAGNVQEWCMSYFGAYPYDPNDGREALVYSPQAANLLPKLHETGCVANPLMNEASIGKQTIRGGSWRESKHESRCAYRSWAAPMHRSDDTGFRCAYEIMSSV
jgi:formylglycine-generating enzyme required for sulfatase activity